MKCTKQKRKRRRKETVNSAKSMNAGVSGTKISLSFYSFGEVAFKSSSRLKKKF